MRWATLLRSWRTFPRWGPADGIRKNERVPLTLSILYSSLLIFIPLLTPLFLLWEQMVGQDHDPRYRAVAICGTTSLLAEDAEAPPKRVFLGVYSKGNACRSSRDVRYGWTTNRGCQMLLGVVLTQIRGYWCSICGTLHKGRNHSGRRNKLKYTIRLARK